MRCLGGIRMQWVWTGNVDARFIERYNFFLRFSFHKGIYNLKKDKSSVKVVKTRANNKEHNITYLVLESNTFYFRPKPKS